MGDLIDFLNRCLDEDERIARKVAEHHGEPHLEWSLDEIYNVAGVDAAEHIARHDPCSVLADIAAKRLILRVHWVTRYTNRDLGIVDAVVCAVCHVVLDCPDDGRESDWPYPLVQELYPCRTLRLIACAYAHRDGYQTEWSEK